MTKTNGIIRIIALWIIFGTSIFCTGCTKNNSEASQWRKLAKTKAVDFVVEKYGFEKSKIKIKDVTSLSTSQDIFDFPSATPLTYVKIKYEDKDFLLVTDGSSQSQVDTRDNYQKDLICDAIEDVIKNISIHPITDVETSYRVPTEQEEYLAHNIYEVSKDATLEDKITALQEVFNYQYNHEPKEAGNGYTDVSICIFFSTAETEAMEQETFVLGGELLGIENLDLYEFAFIDEKSLTKQKSTLLQHYPLYTNYALFLNQATHFSKEPGYLGSVDSEKYTHTYLNGYECVLINCNTEEASINILSSEQRFVPDYGAGKQTISELFCINAPEDARIIVYIPEEVFGKNVAIGKDYYATRPGGNKIKRRTIIGKNNRAAYYIPGYYFAEGGNGDSFCFLKD